MKLLERILIATDFSPGADGALVTGSLVAKRFGSEVTLVHVIPGTVDFASQYRAMICERATKRLEEIATRMRAEGIETVDTVVESGVPFDQVDRIADARDVNVIVIGACKTAEDGPLVGTTAARLRRYATKPVWMVTPGIPPNVTRILCPVDFSEPSGRGLNNAIHLARGFKAHLTVLTVLPTATGYYEGLGEIHTDLDDASAQKEFPQFEQFLRQYDFHDVTCEKLVRSGDPAHEILKAAGEFQSDLLVMGTVGKSGFLRIRLGSVSRKVAQRMPCSIVTVKSEHAVRLRVDAEVSDVHDCFKQGVELLENGFPQEALRLFQKCIAKNMLFVPAWKELAAAHKRLGHCREARKCEQQARHITERIEHDQINADVRSRHPLFRKTRHYL